MVIYRYIADDGSVLDREFAPGSAPSSLADGGREYVRSYENAQSRRQYIADPWANGLRSQALSTYPRNAKRFQRQLRERGVNVEMVQTGPHQVCAEFNSRGERNDVLTKLKLHDLDGGYGDA